MLHPCHRNLEVGVKDIFILFYLIILYCISSRFILFSLIFFNFRGWSVGERYFISSCFYFILFYFILFYFHHSLGIWARNGLGMGRNQIFFKLEMKSEFTRICSDSYDSFHSTQIPTIPLRMAWIRSECVGEGKVLEIGAAGLMYENENPFGIGAAVLIYESFWKRSSHFHVPESL